MRVGAQAAATATVIGAALIVAALHGAGGRGADGSAQPGGRAGSYQPPAVAVMATPHEQVTVAHAAKPRAASRAVARRVPGRPVTAGTVTGRTAIASTHSTRPARPRRSASGQPFTAALMAAVGQIPTYRPGASRWVVSTAYDFWGTADWYHDVLYVSPDVPRNRLYDVAVHEWSHELSVLDYAGDVASATKAMNAWFGGSGLSGPERAADCMAILQHATWTHYTSCTNRHWRAGAARLIHGEQL